MDEEKLKQEQSWRVHPAAELFEPMPEHELAQLAQDINVNGLKEKITVIRSKHGEYVVIDGRNRLTAMGMGRTPIDPERHFEALEPDINPFTYVISKNILRRHLTKKQQAEIIARAMMAAENDFAKSARSFSPESGRRGGSTKDPLKEKIINKAKEYDIGKRTVEEAYANVKGPTQKPRTEKQASETTEDPTDNKSLEEQLRESEQLRRQTEAHAQKEIGRLEAELRDARKTEAVLRDVIEKLKSKNAKHQETEKELNATIRRLKTELNSRRFSSVGNRFDGTIHRTDITRRRREISKKYHPDRNGVDKKFSAHEVMADFNRLCDELVNADQ
jgi:hypothetical protein